MFNLKAIILLFILATSSIIFADSFLELANNGKVSYKIFFDGQNAALPEKTATYELKKIS